MFYLYKWDWDNTYDSVHGIYDTLEEAFEHVYDYRGTTYYSPPSRIINKETGETIREFRRPRDHPTVSMKLKEKEKKTIKGRWGLSGLPTTDNPNADDVMRLSESEAIERNNFICARVAEGDSVEGLAEEVGLSVERVREISKLWSSKVSA